MKNYLITTAYSKFSDHSEDIPEIVKLYRFYPKVHQFLPKMHQLK
ncbi:MAG: hypothetical protein QM594_09165 [Niabella sp.]